MDILEKLFGSTARVKIMKLFLLNPDEVFEPAEVKKRARSKSEVIRRELKLLNNIGFIRKQNFQKKNAKGDKWKQASGWVLDPTFPYLRPLQTLLIYSNSFNPADIKKKFNKYGQWKLMIISGIFIQDWDSRVDLLLVGDNLKTQSIHSAIKSLESEVGRELKYSILTTSEFQYRLTMCDKLIRDILDYPHTKAVNKLDI